MEVFNNENVVMRTIVNFPALLTLSTNIVKVYYKNFYGAIPLMILYGSVKINYAQPRWLKHFSHVNILPNFYIKSFHRSNMSENNLLTTNTYFHSKCLRLWSISAKFQTPTPRSRWLTQGQIHWFWFDIFILLVGYFNFLFKGENMELGG